MSSKVLKSLKKRVKLTKRGLIKRQKAFGSHLLSKYRNTVRRRKKKTVFEEVQESAFKVIKKLRI